MTTNADHVQVSFSIVLEGFTITEENADTLWECLSSLASQTPSPEAANEVLIMETGHVARPVLE